MSTTLMCVSLEEDVATGKVDKKVDDQDLVWHLFNVNLLILVLFFLLFSFLLIRKKL